MFKTSSYVIHKIFHNKKIQKEKYKQISKSLAKQSAAKNPHKILSVSFLF